MCEGREITGSADRALRGNHWMDATVQHGEESFNKDGADAAQSFCQRIRAKQNYRARLRFGKRSANSAGMAAN